MYWKLPSDRVWSDGKTTQKNSDANTPYSAQSSAASSNNRSDPMLFPLSIHYYLASTVLTLNVFYHFLYSRAIRSTMVERPQKVNNEISLKKAQPTLTAKPDWLGSLGVNRVETVFRAARPAYNTFHKHKMTHFLFTSFSQWNNVRPAWEFVTCHHGSSTWQHGSSYRLTIWQLHFAAP